jgi:hypothetical protein
MGVETAMYTMGLEAEGDEALGARVVAGAGKILSPDEVAEAVLAGVAAESFLILPHPEVAEYYRLRATDTDRWLGGMNKIQRAFEGDRG